VLEPTDPGSLAGESTLDRMSNEVYGRKKQVVETVVTAFTHNLPILRLTLHIPCIQRGKGFWRMNISYLGETSFHNTLRKSWENWQGHIKYYRNRALWWERYERMIRQIFLCEGTKRRCDRIRLEKFYYNAKYDVPQDSSNHATKAEGLKKLKAKIIRLHSERQGILGDTGERDRIAGEQPTLHHLLKARKRQEARIVHQIYDNHGTLLRTSAHIMQMFTEHTRN
jgi:hypothetical protein